MKAVPFAFRGVLLGLITTSLHAQGPVLSTPGTATWTEETTVGGGIRTIFTITDNTVLDWNQLNLGTGNELVFDFVNGQSVVNNLNGSRTHYISGDVISNGNVGFFSPNAKLIIDGSITAKGVTLATLAVDPIAFASGGDFVMTGADGERLSVRGSIHATQGDVVIAGEKVRIDTGAVISVPNGGAFFAGGNEVAVSPNGAQRIRVIGSIGDISHNGTTTAGSAEVVAAESVKNNGRIDVGAARLFIQVGEEGRISNEGNGVLVGNSVFEGALVDEGEIIMADDGDVPPLINESRLKVPTLKRSDGSKITTRQTVSYTAPMSASSDGGRAAKSKNRQVAKVDSSKSLLKRGSFFGMRGGKTVASR